MPLSGHDLRESDRGGCPWGLKPEIKSTDFVEAFSSLKLRKLIYIFIIIRHK
jgi:hypothetical protein